MLRNILARRFSPTPSIGSIYSFLDLTDCPQPSDLVWLESMHVIAFPVFGPLSGRDRVTHRTHLPDRLPLIQLRSIKSSCKSS